MVSEKELTFFYGDRDDENPYRFLKTVSAIFSDTAKDDYKVNQLSLRLAPDSVAEEWFDALNDATEKDTWLHLTVAFKKKWPKTVGPTLSAREIANILKAKMITAAELGKYVEVADRPIATHIRWVREVCRLAKQYKAPDHIATEIRDLMPKPLRDLVTDEVEKWDELKSEVEKVRMRALQETAEDFRKAEERTRALENENKELRDAVLQRSPTTALRQGLQHLQLTPPPPYRMQAQGPPNPTSDNPFIGGGPPQPGNLFYDVAHQRQGPFRPNQERLTILNRNALPHLAPDDVGCAGYQAQVTLWRTQHSNITHPNEDFPFPLTPGTMPLGSDECYRCARARHASATCDANPATIIPTEEGNFRAIAGKILRNARQGSQGGRRNAAPVQYVGYTPAQYYVMPAPDNSHAEGPSAHIENWEEGKA